MTQRFIVDLRDGGLFAGQVRVYAKSADYGRGALLSNETAEALGLDVDERPRGSAYYYRLHTCRNCGQQFIAHFAARACSKVCVDARQQIALARHRRPRKPKQEPRISVTEAMRRRGEVRICKEPECQNPLEMLKSTKMFCSDACRQRVRRAVKGAW